MTALISNSFLDEQSVKIRVKPVPWEGYQRADLIDANELSLIRKVDRQPRSKADSILLSDGPAYALLYLSLLKKLSRVDTMQYILVLMNEALSDHEERIPLFLGTAEQDPDLPYNPLLKALDSNDEYVQLSAAQALTTLMSTSTTPLHVLKAFLKALAGYLNPSSTDNKRDVAVQCFESLLSRSEVRQEVWSQPDIIRGLVYALERKPTAQMAYQAVFCFWLLTFDVDIAEQLNAKYDIIPLLVDTAQGAVKEKVIRVVMATFRNMVTKAPSENLPSMLVAKLLPYVRSLASRKLSDEEVQEDVTFLQEELGRKFESLTTYDEYTSELKSGHLAWSPVHDSETFWKENASKLNDRDQEQIKLLVRLLKESEDPTVLAVAAHDIGQFAKYYDPGRTVLTNLGAKTRVMELMTHSSPEVRYRALMSVQRLVSASWVRN